MIRAFNGKGEVIAEYRSTPNLRREQYFKERISLVTPCTMVKTAKEIVEGQLITVRVYTEEWKGGKRIDN